MSDTRTPLEGSGELVAAGRFNLKPNYNIIFHNGGKEVGRLDFNGPKMVFSGSLDESAKVFFDYIATAFAGRLADERKAYKRKAAHFDALRDELRACDVRMGLATECVEAERYDEALLHLCSLRRQRLEILSAADEIGGD